MQPAQFCTTPGCFETRIGAARSREKCRTHYRELLAAADLVQVEVVAGEGSRGQLAGVTDCVTNQTVRHGGVALLDPVETNIAALVAGGVVKVIPSPAAEKAKK